MKLLFFHTSNSRIEKFAPRTNDPNDQNIYNFFWVDDRYHSYTPYESPDKFIHLFIADPWRENFDFYFMQGIGKSQEQLIRYYDVFGIKRQVGSAPILRIRTIVHPLLLGEYEGRGIYNFGQEKVRMFDGVTPIPFLYTKLGDLLQPAINLFPLAKAG